MCWMDALLPVDGEKRYVDRTRSERGTSPLERPLQFFRQSNQLGQNQLALPI